MVRDTNQPQRYAKLSHKNIRKETNKDQKETA